MAKRIEHHNGAYLIFGTGGGREGKLVQADWDYPAEAEALGWSLRRVQTDLPAQIPLRPRTRILKRSPPRGKGCDHRCTDGTVDCCACGVTASEFIGAAGEYLSSKAW